MTNTEDLTKFDPAFFKPFVEGTLHTLKVQASLDVTPGKPKIKNKQEGNPPFAISGLIGLNSKEVQGSIALCFEKPVFLDVMSRMLGEPCAEITDELADGAAELLNIIFGQAKRVLNDGGYTLEKALPTVIKGQNIRVDSPKNEKTIVLPFTTAKGLIHLEITIQR